MMRRLVFVMLCLALVATGHSAGAARAVGQMVFCAGPDTVAICVGADGAPTQVPHLCPDCTLHLLHMLPVDSPDLGAAPALAHFVGLAPVAIADIRVPRHALARAPPRLI